MIKKKNQKSLPEKNRKSEREQHGKIAKDNELDCGLFGNIGRLPYYNTHTIFHLVMVLPINKSGLVELEIVWFFFVVVMFVCLFVSYLSPSTAYVELCSGLS